MDLASTSNLRSKFVWEINGLDPKSILSLRIGMKKMSLSILQPHSFEKLALAVLYNYSTTRGHLPHRNPTVWATLSEVAILLSLWAYLSVRQACLLLELINLLCLVLTIHHSQGREAFACLWSGLRRRCTNVHQPHIMRISRLPTCLKSTLPIPSYAAKLVQRPDLNALWPS
jgi:hypothetical protein